jgi:regulatory protein
MHKKPLTKELALQKLRHYCRYQARCHHEVKNKLFELGVDKNDYEEMIIELVEENYLDEERFAIAFAIGKFKMKQWGKNRIRYSLKEKMVNQEIIVKSLDQINDKEYTHVLKKLAREKYASLKNEQWVVRKKKTMDYLVQKGYEMELVSAVMKGMKEK